MPGCGGTGSGGRDGRTPHVELQSVGFTCRFFLKPSESVPAGEVVRCAGTGGTPARQERLPSRRETWANPNNSEPSFPPVSALIVCVRWRTQQVPGAERNDSPARIDPEEAAIGRPTATARRLVEASVSENTRRAYAGALRRLDTWLDGRELDDAELTAYVAELHDAGRASSSASMAVAAACFRAKLGFGEQWNGKYG